MKLEQKKKILNAGKSTELLEAEADALADMSIDIDESEKEMIRQDAASADEAEEIIAAERETLVKKAAVKKAKEKVNDEVPSSILTQLPAGGPTKASGTIHMKHSYYLLKGRSNKTGKFEIMGLYAAAKQMNFLISSYRRGCLYAAKFLIDVETELKHLSETFKVKEKENEEFLKSLTLMEVEPFESNKPMKPDWVYVSPYAWHMNDLLLRYDLILRKCYPYFAMRMIDRDEFKNRVTSMSRDLRRLFSMGNSYFFVGPESFIKKDAVYLQAVTNFGELDKDIIERKRVPHLVEIPKQFI